VNLRNLEKRLERLEKGSGEAQVNPEVAAVLKEVESDPEWRATCEQYGGLVSQVHERLKNSDEIPEITSEEEEALARSWDALHQAALRIARQRGIDPKDILRALMGR